MAKRMWTAEVSFFQEQEDGFLKQCVNVSQNKRWVEISEQFNSKFNGQPRTAKQCRERFINHITNKTSETISNQWSLNELGLLFQLYEAFGPRWTLISQKIPNKSQNVVKNKFNCSVRKFVRRLNKHIFEQKRKCKKKIKHESVIRAIEAFQNFQDLPENFKQNSLSLKQKIISLVLAHALNQIIPKDDMQQIVEKLNRFNLQTRSYRAKKIKTGFSSQQKNEVTMDKKLKTQQQLLFSIQNDQIQNKIQRIQKHNRKGRRIKFFENIKKSKNQTQKQKQQQIIQHNAFSNYQNQQKIKLQNQNQEQRIIWHQYLNLNLADENWTKCNQKNQQNHISTGVLGEAQLHNQYQQTQRQPNQLDDADIFLRLNYEPPNFYDF